MQQYIKNKIQEQPDLPAPPLQEAEGQHHHSHGHPDEDQEPRHERTPFRIDKPDRQPDQVRKAARNECGDASAEDGRRNEGRAANDDRLPVSFDKDRKAAV
nr:hypothetical protein [Paenibacillus mucilaginosus]